tara:strand:+ start:56 stop:472 length:417 start_codon:yes stop_codon:yes gene_type:complete
MGFKLGSERGNYAVSGEIKTKMRFNKQIGDNDVSVPGTPVIRKPLKDGIMGEANMDGSIYISDKIVPGSRLEQDAIREEMVHATEIKLGKLGYTDNSIYYNGVTYPRETIDGKDMILVDGQWKEAGDHKFPWEKKAKI